MRALLLAHHAPPARQDAASPGELAREILAEGGYQTRLPGADEEPFRPFFDLAELLRVVGWVLALLTLAVLVAWLVARWRGRRAPELELDPAAPRPAALALGAKPLEEAERLAREGRYGEAVRVLLQLTFEALREAGALQLEPWRTARGLARAARLSGAGREALGELVRAAELAVFAGREPSGADYERCAGRYRDLLLLAQEGGA